MPTETGAPETIDPGNTGAEQAPSQPQETSVKKKRYKVTEEDRMRKQLEAAKALKYNLRTMLEDGDEDAELIHDMIEGETDLFEMCETIHGLIAEDEEQIAGIKERQEAISRRKSRIERRRNARKAMLLQAVMLAGQSIRLTEVTIGKSPGRARLVVKEKTEVPSQFFKRPPPEVDTAALKAAILELEKQYPEGVPPEEVIPGAVIEYGADSLSMRKA